MNTSPAVQDQTVYAVGSGDPGYVFALDPTTKTRRWRFTPSGYASASPLIIDNSLYVGTSAGYVYSIDTQTGDSHWRRDIGHRITGPTTGLGDGSIYFGTAGVGELQITGEETDGSNTCAFLALDSESGDLLWSYRNFEERERIESSPAIAAGHVVFASQRGLYCLNSADGSEVWYRDISTHPGSAPLIRNGVVYYSAPDGSGGPPAYLGAYDIETGETIWTTPIEEQSVRTTPAIADQTLYVPGYTNEFETESGGSSSSDKSGNLYAFDSVGGELLWKTPIEADVRSSPAVTDEAIYVGCGSGVSAVSRSGDPLWRRDFESDTEVYVESSPAVSGDSLFIGASDGALRIVTTT